MFILLCQLLRLLRRQKLSERLLAMTKAAKVILIISLLVNSTGQGYALRPQATREIAELLIIEDVDVDLSAEDAYNIGEKLIEMMLGCPEGKRILLKCKPETPAEFEAAGKLGFTQCVSAEELAAFVFQELRSGTARIEGNTVKFSKEVMLGGSAYKSIELFCRDSSVSTRFKNAMEKSRDSDINSLLKYGQAAALGIPMTIRDERCLGVLAEILGVRAAELKQKFISEEEAVKIRKEQKQKADYENESRALSWHLSEIDRSLARLEYEEALLLLKNTPHTDWRARPDKEKRQMQDKLEERKREAVSALADEELEDDNPEAALELIKEHFSADPKDSKVRAKLEQAKKDLTAKERLRKEEEAKRENERIERLIKDGLWNDACEALQDAAKKFSGLKIFSDVDGRLKKIAELAREDDPFWIPDAQMVKLVGAGAIYSLMSARKISPGISKPERIKLQRNSARHLRGEFLKQVEALPEPRFDKIVAEVRGSVKRESKASKMDIEEMHAAQSLIPETKEGFAKLIDEVRSNLPSAEEWAGVESLPREGRLKTPFYRDRLIRYLMFHFAAAITETQYDRYYDGTTAHKVTLHPLLTSKDLDKQEKAHEKRRTFLQQEISLSKKSSSKEEAMRSLSRVLMSYLEGNQPLFPLAGPGGGFFPSLAAVKALMELGARPILSPKDLAKKLERKNIYSIDILTPPPAGTPVIRVIMKKNSIFDGPVSPVPFLYIFPCNPKRPGEPMSLEEVREMVEDWEGTCKRLGDSEWDSPRLAFYVAGIGYDWLTEDSLKILIPKVFTEMPEQEQAGLVSRIWKDHKNFKSRYSAEAKLITGEQRRFMDGEAVKFICIANYFYECHSLYGFCPQSLQAAREFMEALMGEGCEDIRAQVGMVRARQGEIFSKALQHDIAGFSDKERHSHYLEIARNTLDILNKWKRLDDGAREDLSAPWSALTGWDENAPKEETAEVRGFYSDIWHKRAEFIAEAVSIAAASAKIFDRLFIGIDEEGHLQDNRGFSLLASELGYRPFIKEEELAKLIENPDACLSVEVVEEEGGYPPFIIFNLNEKKGWRFIREKVRDFPEGEESRFGIVLTKGRTILKGEEFDRAVKELVRDGKLVRADAKTPLAEAIRDTTARVAVVHIMADGREFVRGLFKGAKKGRPGESARKLLRDIEDVQCHQFTLDEVVAGPYDERIISEAMAKIERYIETGRLKQANHVIDRTLGMLQVDKGGALLRKREEIARIAEKNSLVAGAEVALKRRGLDRIKESLKALEAFLCGERVEVTEERLRETAEVKADSNILKIWKALRRPIRLDEERRRLIGEAEALLGKKMLAEARAKADEAVSHSGEGLDTKELFNRLTATEDEVKKEGIIKELGAIEKKVKRAEEKSAAKGELAGLRREVYQLEKGIEEINSDVIQEELFGQAEELLDRISEVMSRVIIEEEENRQRIHDELKALNRQIPEIKFREKLTEAGRELRRKGREIERYEGKDKPQLKELYAEAEKTYTQRQAEINSAIDKLRREVRAEFDNARGAVDISNKKLLLNTKESGFAACQKAIIQIPSNKVRQELAFELDTWKEAVTIALDKIKAGEIGQELEALRTNLLAVDEKTAKREEAAGMIDEEGLTEKIVSLADKDASERLFNILDELTVIRDKKISGVEQEALIREIRLKIERFLGLIRFESPVTVEFWLSSKGTNAFTAIEDALDVLDREYEGSRQYAEEIEANVKHIIEVKRKELMKKRISYERRKQEAVPPKTEQAEEQPKKAGPKAAETARKKKTTRAASVHEFREKLSRAETADDIKSIIEKLRDIIATSEFSAQRLGEYVGVLQEATEKHKPKTGPAKSSSAGANPAKISYMNTTKAFSTAV